MKRVIALMLLTILLPAMVGAQTIRTKGFGSYDLLTGANIANDDRWILWDTSAGAVKNVLYSELVSKMSTDLGVQQAAVTVVITSGSTNLGTTQLRKTIVNTGATEDITLVLPECSISTDGYIYAARNMSTTYSITITPNVENYFHQVGTVDPFDPGQSIKGPLIIGSITAVVCSDFGDSEYNWLMYDDGYWIAQ